MARNRIQLIEDAGKVKVEKNIGANTAERIGSLLEDIAWYLNPSTIVESPSTSYKYAVTTITAEHPEENSEEWKDTREEIISSWTKNTILWTKTTLTWNDGSHVCLYNGDRYANDGEPGQAIVVDGSSITTYALTEFNSPQPEDSAFTDYNIAITELKNGKRWLWTRTETKYRKTNSNESAGSSVTYSVSYVPYQIRSLMRSTEYYKISANSNEQIPFNPDNPGADGWSPIFSTSEWGSSKPYIWNCTLNEFDIEPAKEFTSPHIITRWAKDGITEVKMYEFYQVLSKDAEKPDLPSLVNVDLSKPIIDGWQRSSPNLNNISGKVIWNFELIVTKSGDVMTASTTEVHLNSYISQDGDAVSINSDGYWVINGSITNIKAEGKDGTGIALKGSVDVVFNDDIEESETSLEGLTNLTVGDCYVVNETNHLYFYDGASTAITGVSPTGWKDIGAFRGEGSYTHIAYTTSDPRGVTESTVNNIGFTVIKESDTNYPWMGICVDNSNTDPGSNWDSLTNNQRVEAVEQYSWNYIKGEAGRGISTTTEYYLVTNQSSGVTYPTTTGWTSDMSEAYSSWSEDAQYLWNCEVVTYSDNTSDVSTPQIIATYAEFGGGIDSIVNYYKVNDSLTAPSIDDTWTTNTIPPDPTNPYLWNYEKITGWDSA